MLLKSPFFPKPEDSRYDNDSDVVKARKTFYEQRSKNLHFLLRHRYQWMQHYINPIESVGVEVGCGIGVTKEYIKAKLLLLTDFGEYEWLDTMNVDAMSTPFKDNEFDFVLCSNMIHHLPNPSKFFQEMNRIIKPNGYLLVQEVNCSFFMRLVLRLMRKEGYSFDVDVFDKNAELSDPTNAWSANNAIPNLLFDNHEKFHKNISTFSIIADSPSEFLLFFNSGGVTAKTPYIPLPYWLLKIVQIVDRMLIAFSKNTFALQRSVVLQKKETQP